MVTQLFEELSKLSQVEAIALGGSRAGENYDEKSDYDIYLYCTAEVPEDARREILSRYCKEVEYGNHFWELEDNGTLNNGIDFDILYRNLDDFTNEVASVVEGHQAHNGYTTCMWHNLNTCKIIYDENGRLQKAKERFSVSYPKQLKENIIHQNGRLLHGSFPAYDAQIAKANKRGDIVSVSHRTAAFFESYFDIIWALNEKTHPGEKRLVSLCKQYCEILPRNFEENITKTFHDLYIHPENTEHNIKTIIDELNKVLEK